MIITVRVVTVIVVNVIKISMLGTVITIIVENYRYYRCTDRNIIVETAIIVTVVTVLRL